jgi:hypothetical protein
VRPMSATGPGSSTSRAERDGPAPGAGRITPRREDERTVVGSPDSPGGGVCFPAIGGSRSTTATGRAIVADAARAADAGLAERIESASAWRSDYLSLVRELTEACAVAPQSSLAISEAGLASMRARMMFERGGQTIELEQALRAGGGESFHIGEITGTGEPVTELSVPYRGHELRGAELEVQLDAWVRSSVVEPSFAMAIRRVIEHPEWLALPGRRVAVIGAGAEMGPLEPLSRWGAHVIAIDLPVEKIWNRITDMIRQGSGRATIPLGTDGTPGIDVVRSLPETRTWLDEAASGDHLVLGMYAYADGGAHVCVTAAVDVLGTDLLERREGTALAYLATPTDAFVVPEEAVAEARAAYASRGLRRILQAPVRVVSRGNLFAPAYPGTSTVADVLVAQQGPNYALAKRIQRWRGLTASADGFGVSFNVAPATWTRSVTKNRVLAAAYTGARHFGIEIFAPATSRVLMAALLVHDLNEPSPEQGHPEALFSEGAAHGGLWRAAYQPRSVLGVAALTGLRTALRSPARSGARGSA